LKHSPKQRASRCDPDPGPRSIASILASCAKRSSRDAKCACTTSIAARKRGYQTVHPYGFLYGKRHYLVAWSELDAAKDFRNFALSNIERVELLDQTFARKRDFSITKYAERSFGVFQEKPVDVVWKFTPKAAEDASEFLFHPTQETERLKDGSLVVRFRAGGLLEMSWHLFTWGNEVEIIKPKRLASMLREQSEAQVAHSVRMAS
jgi:predicted DNA-binding transcriptional regulator YafY